MFTLTLCGPKVNFVCVCLCVCVCGWGGGGEGVLGGNLSPYRYKASPPPHRPILSVTHRTQPSNSQPPQQQGCRFFLLSQNHPSNLFGLKAINSDPALYSTNFVQRQSIVIWLCILLHNRNQL